MYRRKCWGTQMSCSSVHFDTLAYYAGVTCFQEASIHTLISSKQHGPQKSRLCLACVVCCSSSQHDLAPLRQHTF